MKPTKCPVCKENKRGFWETEYDSPCSDCRDKENKENLKKKLTLAVKSGKVKPEFLTPLGRELVYGT